MGVVVGLRALFRSRLVRLLACSLLLLLLSSFSSQEALTVPAIGPFVPLPSVPTCTRPPAPCPQDKNNAAIILKINNKVDPMLLEIEESMEDCSYPRIHHP